MKILVISLAGIGDTILATPLIRELRANFPKARIEALVMWSGSRDILAGNPALDEVHFKNLMSCPKREALGYLARLRARNYDVSINTHPQSRVHYRLTAWYIGAAQRFSHTYECCGFWDRLLITKAIPQDYTVHTVENNLRLLSLMGDQSQQTEHSLEVFLKEPERTWAAGFLCEHKLEDRPWIGVHVGSGGTKNLTLKRWPLAQYRALFHKISKSRPDVTIVLFGGPGEETEINSIIAEHEPGRVIYAHTPNLMSAGALLEKAPAFLSVDTALMHLAAAVRTPGQVVIEAPTLNVTNYPYANPFKLVANPAVGGRNLDYYKYDGGGIKGTTGELVRCMESVTPEMVFAALAEVLGR